MHTSRTLPHRGKPVGAALWTSAPKAELTASTFPSSPLLTFIKTLKFLEQLRRTLDNLVRRCEIAAGNGPIYVASIFPPQKNEKEKKRKEPINFRIFSPPLFEKNFCVFWQTTRLLTKKKSQYIRAIYY